MFAGFKPGLGEQIKIIIGLFAVSIIEGIP
jgi:hypothetical protein